MVRRLTAYPLQERLGDQHKPFRVQHHLLHVEEVGGACPGGEGEGLRWRAPVRRSGRGVVRAWGLLPFQNGGVEPVRAVAGGRYAEIGCDARETGRGLQEALYAAASFSSRSSEQVA